MLSNQKNMTSWLNFFRKLRVPPSFRKHVKALANARSLTPRDIYLVMASRAAVANSGSRLPFFGSAKTNGGNLTYS